MNNKLSTNNNKAIGKTNVSTYTNNKVIKNKKGNDKQHAWW